MVLKTLRNIIVATITLSAHLLGYLFIKPKQGCHLVLDILNTSVRVKNKFLLNGFGLAGIKPCCLYCMANSHIFTQCLVNDFSIIEIYDSG